ncbi:hypothetical protein LTR94_025957, partial [Friedmanniomyces endolithicus]
MERFMSIALRTSALSGLALLSLAACVSPSPSSPAADVVAAPSQDYAQLLDDVRILAADDMEGRSTGSPGGEKARAYLVSRLEALGVAPASFGRLQPFEMSGRSPQGPMTFKGANVLGLIPGSRVSDRYIVVSAHYDHVGVHDGEIFNGADDNASGVATMLELVARLKAQPPEHSVIIVAFDGEERGLLGAREFVKAPPVPLTSIALNLNLDMTSRAETDNHLWVTGTYQHPHLRPILAAVAPKAGVSFAFGKDTPQDQGEDNWVDSSDHGVFHAMG